MKVAVGRLPRSANDFVEFAALADECGYWAVGAGDSHFLYQETYTAATAAFLRTSRIRVGPFVTNFVTRSWSVHASALRTWEELQPGRSVFGVASGDGSVFSVGRRPQSWSSFEEDAGQWRERVPRATPMHVAVSGPRGAQSAGQVGDAIVVMLGADATAVSAMCTRAEGARTQISDGRPFERWAAIYVNVVDRKDEVADATEAMLDTAIATARYSMAATFEDKNFPEEFQPRLRAAFDRYNHQYHVSRGTDNPNRRLLDDDPELRRYIQNRMTVVGTREQVADRLLSLVEESALDGLWIAVTAPKGPDVIKRLSEALGDAMDVG